MWNLEDIKRFRLFYLILFLIIIIGNILLIVFMIQEDKANYILIRNTQFVVIAGFLYFFWKVAIEVLHYETVVIILLSIVILFIPVVSIITIAYIDNQIFREIRREEEEWGIVVSEFYGLTVWSLLCFFLPFVGLSMAIYALYKIAHSEGKLRGQVMGWISLIVNLASTSYLMWAFIR